MAFFANTWINYDLKNASNTVIVKHLYSSDTKRERRLDDIVPVAPQPTPTGNMKSVYFRDMVTVEKHMKAGYSKDVTTGKHKKSSYVREFVQDK